MLTMSESEVLLPARPAPARYHHRRPWATRLKRLLRPVDTTTTPVDLPARDYKTPLRITEPTLASLTPNLIDLSDSMESLPLKPAVCKTPQYESIPELPVQSIQAIPEPPVLTPRTSSLFSMESLTRAMTDFDFESFDFTGSRFSPSSLAEYSSNTSCSTNNENSLTWEQHHTRLLERELRFQMMILRELKDEIREEKEKTAFLSAKLCDLEANSEACSVETLTRTVSHYKDTCRRLHRYQHDNAIPEQQNKAKRENGQSRTTRGFSCQRVSRAGLPHLVPITTTTAE